MKITQNQIEDYRRDGFVVLPDFVDPPACDRLRARAEQLVHEFDPGGIVSIFSTHEQNRLSDDYFLGSGDKIRFFFEEDAFQSDGTLKQDKNNRSTRSATHFMIWIPSSVNFHEPPTSSI